MTPQAPTRRRRHRLGPVALVAVVLLAPACDQVDQAVGAAGDAVATATEAVAETSELVQFCTSAARVAKAVEDEDIDAAVEHGESMVEHAPDEIAPSAKTVLAHAKDAQGGDYSGLQSQEFEDAAAAVATFTKDRCDPR